jgi:fermentation-respiration switch protein FrsA (DUF1100 family)
MQTATRLFTTSLVVVSLLATVRPCEGQSVSASASSSNSGSRTRSFRTIDELLLFFPTKFPDGNWQPENLKYEDVFFEAVDKTRVHGWYCPCEKPRAVILIAHGNAGHVAHRAGWLRYLQTEARVTTLMFDYRGYGRSAGKPTVPGVLQDARAARAKLCELAGVKDSELLLMGESLGGAVAVQLAAESAPRGLILQSTFSSLRDAANVHFPRLSWLVPKNKLDSFSAISRYKGPLLQSHGTTDGTIPFLLGEKLHRAANQPKTLLKIPGAGHNNWMTQDYLDRLDQFIDQTSR